MPTNIDTPETVDQKGPPPHNDGLYLTLPGQYGEIRCHQHRWKSGNVWGITLGDYNRGEIMGDEALLQARTSEKNDSEGIQGNGRRAVVAKLVPGPALKPGMEVLLKVYHSLWGNITAQAMSNVEKDPPAIAAQTAFSWKQFDKTFMDHKVSVIADKQTLVFERTANGKTSVTGELEAGMAEEKPLGRIRLKAGEEHSENKREATVRTSAFPPIDGYQIRSADMETDMLSHQKLKSKLFEVLISGSAIALLGDAKGLTEVSLDISSAWHFEAQVLDAEGNVIAE